MTVNEVDALPPIAPVTVTLRHHFAEKVRVTPIFAGEFPSTVEITAVADIVHIARWREETVRLQASWQGASVVSIWTLIWR